MPPRQILSVVVLMFTAALTTGTPTQASQEDAAYAEGELLVRFVDDVQNKSQIHNSLGGRLIERFEKTAVDHIQLPSGTTTESGLKAYRANPLVSAAEPNYYRFPTDVVPDDVGFDGYQWAHLNTGQTLPETSDSGISDADIDTADPNIEAAWDLSTGSSEVVVAVIDTGVQTDHPDLADNIWLNPNEVLNGLDDDGNGYVDDINGWDFAHGDASVYDPTETCDGDQEDNHGTHVAGIIGAVGNNATGFAGVNWDVSIMPLKFISSVEIDETLYCGAGTDADAIEAVDYAVAEGADFLNVSWGGIGFNSLLRAAFERAGAAGVLFAAAAGNTGENLAVAPLYPASFDLSNGIVVAASDNDDDLTSFSNFGGPTHLAAPGVNIASTWASSSYAYASGTSQATPQVTGTLALLRSLYPDVSPFKLRARLLASTDAKPSFASVTRTGGRLNVYKAMTEPWESQGASITSGPDAASWAPNRLDVFARGTDGSLLHKWWDGAKWRGPESLGGVLASDPAAVSWGPNRIDVFVKGTNNALWHKWWDGASWSGWESLGGVLASSPDVASWGPNRLDVVVRGTDNAVWQKWWDGTSWKGWKSLGGAGGGDPSAVSWGPNRLDIFIRGVDDALLHRWYAGKWFGWESLGGDLAGGVDADSWGSNRIDVFSRSDKGMLIHRWWDGAKWRGWETFFSQRSNSGAGMEGDPGVVAWGANRLDVFSRGKDDALHHKWWDGARWRP